MRFRKVDRLFHLFEEKVGPGAEVFSMMRESNLVPAIYEKTFCVTGRDRVQPLNREAAP